MATIMLHIDNYKKLFELKDFLDRLLTTSEEVTLRLYQMEDSQLHLIFRDGNIWFSDYGRSDYYFFLPGHHEVIIGETDDTKMASRAILYLWSTNEIMAMPPKEMFAGYDAGEQECIVFNIQGSTKLEREFYELLGSNDRNPDEEFFETIEELRNFIYQR